MMGQNLQENISPYMLRQIAIVRQMVYNLFSVFDVTKNLLWNRQGLQVPFPFVAALVVPKSMAIPCGRPVFLMECELWSTFRLQKLQKNGESQDAEYKRSAHKEESKDLSVWGKLGQFLQEQRSPKMHVTNETNVAIRSRNELQSGLLYMGCATIGTIYYTGQH